MFCLEQFLPPLIGDFQLERQLSISTPSVLPRSDQPQPHLVAHTFFRPPRHAKQGAEHMVVEVPPPHVSCFEVVLDSPIQPLPGELVVSRAVPRPLRVAVRPILEFLQVRSIVQQDSILAVVAIQDLEEIPAVKGPGSTPRSSILFNSESAKLPVLK